MCIMEYNEAETVMMLREDGREEGRDKSGKPVSLLMSAGRGRDIHRTAADRQAKAVLHREI